VALARLLRATRTRRRLTQFELAERIGSSQSRIARIEAGDPSVSVDLLVRSLLAAGQVPRIWPGQSRRNSVSSSFEPEIPAEFSVTPHCVPLRNSLTSAAEIKATPAVSVAWL
jgi:transcriptional regulator with XRE-family HTH domain